MKYTNHIVIERPLEKVFFWMFQPEHIVQLVTWDLTKDVTRNGSIPPPEYSNNPQDADPELIERTARQQRFQGQAETKIEIKNLSTPTLHVGTTFEYIMSMRNLSREFPEFSAWKPMYSGSITIEKFVSSTFFAFTARRPSLPRRFSRPEEHSLTFQAQQESTIMTHTRLIGTGRISSVIVSALIPAMAAFRKEAEWRQLLHLKAQMELEID